MKYLLYNIFINIADNEEYFKAIKASLNQDKVKVFYYLNSHSFYVAKNNQNFCNAMQNADFIIADGYSIVWSLKFLKNIFIEKVVFTYAFLKYLGKYFEEDGIKIYLLGSKENILNKSINSIKLLYPKITITGYHHGYFDELENSNNIISEINNSNTQILIVGMGIPKAELWIDKYKNQINVKCIFSVGAFFDIMADKKKLAPHYLYNTGLEWFYRLLKEPLRLFKRYLYANLYFLFFLLREKFFNNTIK